MYKCKKINNQLEYYLHEEKQNVPTDVCSNLKEVTEKDKNFCELWLKTDMQWTFSS